MSFIILFILGLSVGSFLNCVIYRLDTGESLIKTRSYCRYCKKTLSFIELIPLVSFILQKGKCRHCKKPISLQYPLVELATGVLFLLIISNSQFLISNQSPIPNPQFLNIISIIFWLLVVSCLIIIFVYDLKHYIIPNEVIYPAIIVGFLYILYSLFIIHNSSFYYNFLSAIIAGLFFLAITLISRGKWMGVGDVKLAVFMGLVLGWPKIFLALFLAFLIGALVSIVLIIFKKKTLKSEIPFGPFLVGAMILCLFIGDALLSWYFNLFI